jgi:molybdate transport system substrate-binding protein
MRFIRRAAAAALVIGLAQQAAAAEIKVLCIPAMRTSLEALLPQFERDTGNKAVMHYEIIARQKQQIESGDFDVAIFGKARIEALTKEGRTAAGATDIASTSIGVAVRSGAPKPDIGSEAAFKQTLLAAKSITYTKQSETGVYLARMLERIGVADAIKDKLILQPGGAMTTPAVAKDEAELAIVLVSDILSTPGVDLVGPLPAALQNHVMQTAALNATAKQPAAGAALIKFLSNPAAAPVFKAKGFEPAPR